MTSLKGYGIEQNRIIIKYIHIAKGKKFDHYRTTNIINTHIIRVYILNLYTILENANNLITFLINII